MGYSLSPHPCCYRSIDFIQHKEGKVVLSDKKTQKVVGVSIWGIFLVFIGIVFFLQTLNILPWGLWGTLWRFWPALIIIIGLSILIRRHNIWLVSLLVLAILGACFGIAICSNNSSDQFNIKEPPGYETILEYNFG